MSAVDPDGDGTSAAHEGRPHPTTNGVSHHPDGPFALPQHALNFSGQSPHHGDFLSASESAIQKRIALLCLEGQTDSADWRTPLAFTQKRHLELIEGYENSVDSWRVKDRMKTVSVALVLCLNVGVDPPDVFKPNPCARLECWLAHDNRTARRHYRSAPLGGITAPHSGIAAPHGGIAVPRRGIAAPLGGIAAPHSGITAPHSGITALHSGITAPHGGIAVPQSSIARRGSGIAVPLRVTPRLVRI
ncbi:putative Regulatory-associated protein of mTOR [Hypsibius exemplaris]|uniref:Regulatory-associated protein of mTOR n=1 Tax=Hypsibius exemplaris TaxID=2072580 RepID=A0A9X6NH79_HYPEX|nr:putative Regulatory-associated protein of mTOR [Hypsibius exemplaris]